MQAFHAEAPLHVSGVWVPVIRGDPVYTGSLGAGLLLDLWVEAVARPCGGQGVEVRAAGRRLNRIPSVIDELLALTGLPEGVCLGIDIPLPLGAGFGASGAAALSAALALSPLLGVSAEEAARLAHIAEVSAGTGLGDVAAMFHGRGGLVLRLSPGAPGVARVESLAAPAELVVAPLGSMETREMLGSLAGYMASRAPARLAKVFSSPTLATFLSEARMLSLETGMAPPRLAERLDALASRGVIEGWYVKKKALVVAARPGHGEEARRLLGVEGALVARPGWRPAGGPHHR